MFCLLFVENMKLSFRHLSSKYLDFTFEEILNLMEMKVAYIYHMEKYQLLVFHAGLPTFTLFPIIASKILYKNYSDYWHFPRTNFIPKKSIIKFKAQRSDSQNKLCFGLTFYEQKGHLNTSNWF